MLYYCSASEAKLNHPCVDEVNTVCSPRFEKRLCFCPEFNKAVRMQTPLRVTEPTESAVLLGRVPQWNSIH